MTEQGRLRIFVEVIRDTDEGVPAIKCRREIHPTAFKTSRIPLGNVVIEECLQELQEYEQRKRAE